MKKIVFLLLCFAAVNVTVFGQTNGCDMEWGNWIHIYSTASGGGVYYSFQSSRCTKDGICGYPKIGLKHTFSQKASLIVYLKGYDCNGKYDTYSFSTGGNEIAGQTEYKDPGNWHVLKGVTDVMRVEVRLVEGADSYFLLYDKEKGINEVYVNGKTQGQHNQEVAAKQAEVASQNAQLEQDRRRQEDQNRISEANQQNERLKAQKQEQIRANLEEINQRSRAQAEVANTISSGFASIFNTIQADRAEREIESQNRKRENKFEELERLVQSENGTLEDCSRCSGAGYTECGTCNHTGAKKCSSCFGKGGSECSVCRGTGVGAMNMMCGYCSGKGILDCAICGNSGKQLCTNCNGLGMRFCNSCDGTGQTFKRE